MASNSGGISGIAVTATLVGGLLAYSGLKGKGIAGSVRALLAGNSPATAAQANPISSGSSTPSTTATTSSDDATLLSATGGTGQTYQDFWVAVLGNLGKPSTLGNLEAMAGISNFEGLNSYFNPMNIEWHPGENPAIQGIGNWNSVGVQEYSGFDQGVVATTTFLGEPHWAGVQAALTTGSFALVNAAIKQAYTWAAYAAPAPATADRILSTRMGQ